MLNFNLGKYRGILVSVALFLLLDASVLILNFYISFEIADDAQGVNLAGRQRMLSQRMAKSLFVLNGAEKDSELFESAKKELAFSMGLFDETLQAFSAGGSARGAGNEPVLLSAVDTQEGRTAIGDAQQLWGPYKNNLNGLLNTIDAGQDYSVAMGLAMASASQNNLKLLKLMNDLTINLEQVASSKATRLRYIQTVGISLALINFFIIMFHFVRQLRESDAIVEKARKETTEILETVSEGLFLVDENLIIGSQHSSRLNELLGAGDVSGQPLQTVLETIISEKDSETTRGFIELLFDPRIKEKLVGDLNPLQSVEVNISNPSGGFVTKHLRFDFARAYQDEKISHVLITVLDITQEVVLEKELEKSRKQSESQLEMLTSLLHTHPSLLKSFLDNSYGCYKRINGILSEHSRSSESVRGKTKDIFREVHNFKGEASALNLEYFENAAHAMEDTLSQIMNLAELTGNDFLPFTVQLENLIAYTKQVEQLAGKLVQFGDALSGKPAEEHAEALAGEPAQKLAAVPAIEPADHDFWQPLDDIVENLAGRNGKQIRIVRSGFSEISLQPEYKQRVKEMAIQLLRNAVIHGVESPENRVDAQKPEVGRIDVHLAKISSSEMELSVEDDGQGLNFDALRDKALSLGRWSETEIESWTKRDFINLIFMGGVSTAKTLSKDAGRGVGMNAVKKCVNEYGGKITVSSKLGRSCCFTLTLPIISEAQAMVSNDKVANG